MSEAPPSPSPLPALGLDAGGTQTRWALAGGDGSVLSQGEVAGLSGLLLDTPHGREAIAATLREIATAAGPVRAVVAGVTGFGAEQVPKLSGMLAHALGLAAGAVRAMSDIELVCHAAFARGQGYVVYAGTGSVAAFIDEHGTLQRAGGRGVVIDDAGGGHWIAREALRQVWRADDAEPGVWREWPLAVHMAQHMGGTGWAYTRQWVYGATRGELGMLALAVAAAAREGDAAALALLRGAGAELARLAHAMHQRYGARPVVLAGRVWELHPVVEESLRAALPSRTPVHRLTHPAHHTAARLAATGGTA